MKSNEIAATAAKLVSGDRDRTHGNKRKNHGAIAAHWNAYLHSRMPGIGLVLQPRDVACMMVLLKIARTCNGAHNADDYVDAVGYAAIAGELAGEDAALADKIAADHRADDWADA